MDKENTLGTRDIAKQQKQQKSLPSCKFHYRRERQTTIKVKLYTISGDDTC